jgi:LemA protein
MSMRRGGLAVIGALVVLGLLVLWGFGAYNRLVRQEQEVEAQWAQVENAYQRRLDLIPNLVETVKGAAAFEKDTFTAVAQARNQAVQQMPPANVTDDPQALSRFEASQQVLAQQLSRLLVVVERYPELKATEAFRDLQAQLEGAENRIAVERMRYNDAAKKYNTSRREFPAAVVAPMFGFGEKAYFEAASGAERAPEVKFGKGEPATRTE